MNVVATTSKQTISMPRIASPDLARGMAALLSGSHQDGTVTVLSPGKEISPAFRRALESRHAALAGSLNHRDRTEVAAVVARLLAGFPSARAGDEEAKFVIASYVSALDDLPPWAVRVAAEQWSRGREGEAPAFAPSSAQLHASAERLVSRFAAEQMSLHRLLTARTQPIPEAEHSRVSEGFDRLRAELRKDVPDAAKATVARAAFDARCAELGIDPDSVPDAKPGGERLKMDLMRVPA